MLKQLNILVTYRRDVKQMAGRPDLICGALWFGPWIWHTELAWLVWTSPWASMQRWTSGVLYAVHGLSWPHEPHANQAPRWGWHMLNVACRAELPMHMTGLAQGVHCMHHFDGYITVCSGFSMAWSGPQMGPGWVSYPGLEHELDTFDVLYWFGNTWVC